MDALELQSTFLHQYRVVPQMLNPFNKVLGLRCVSPGAQDGLGLRGGTRIAPESGETLEADDAQDFGRQASLVPEVQQLVHPVKIGAMHADTAIVVEAIGLDNI